MPSISHNYLQPTRKDMTEGGERPQEQKFRNGECSVNANGTCRPTQSTTTPSYAPNSSSGDVEVRNTHGEKTVTMVLSNPSDGKLTKKVKLFTMQVRRKDTGEIIPNGDEDVFKNVYSWTKRSITTLPTDASGLASTAHTFTFPYDVEVYDPVSPRERLQ